jgi:hypothetical protein
MVALTVTFKNTPPVTSLVEETWLVDSEFLKSATEDSEVTGYSVEKV